MQMVVYGISVLDAIISASVIYSLPFMELQPIYTCTSAESPEPYECKAKDFCAKTEVTPTIDWSHDNSLHNWNEHLDMTCSNETSVGMIAALYFIGFVSTIGIAGRLSDTVGRRKVILLGMFIQTVCCFAFLFMDSLSQAKVFIFCYGLGTGLVFGLDMFMQEFMIVSQRAALQTYLQAVDGLTMVIFIFYCLYITK